MDIDKLEKLVEGKTKVVYAHPHNPNQNILYFKDDITAGDGAKRDLMLGKGEINCETTCTLMEYLEKKDIPTHHIDRLDKNTQIVKKVDMIPLECISRQIAYGSLIKKYPFFEKGKKLDKVTIETHFKNDSEHDPPINESLAVTGGLLTQEGYRHIEALTIRTFNLLVEAFAKHDVTLVDYKVEFGKTVDGKIVLGDEVTNDSWRAWPGGDEKKMVDNEIYRKTGDVKKTKVGYEQMLEIIRRF